MSYRQPFRGDFPITQHFGEKITDPKGHTGIDYGCPAGTPILASDAGIVVFCGTGPAGYGNYVILQHNDGKATLYAHLQQIATVLRKKVEQEEVIGYSGSSRNSSGPHLHFEARDKWDGGRAASKNPVTFLPLMSHADIDKPPVQQVTGKLKEPDQLGDLVEVVCPDGSKVFNPDWSVRYAGFPQGTKLHFTGKTEKRPGFPEYTYCEVYEEPKKY